MKIYIVFALASRSDPGLIDKPYASRQAADRRVGEINQALAEYNAWRAQNSENRYFREWEPEGDLKDRLGEELFSILWEIEELRIEEREVISE